MRSCSGHFACVSRAPQRARVAASLPLPSPHPPRSLPTRLNPPCSASPPRASGRRAFDFSGAAARRCGARFGGGDQWRARAPPPPALRRARYGARPVAPPPPYGPARRANCRRSSSRASCVRPLAVFKSPLPPGPRRVRPMRAHAPRARQRQGDRERLQLTRECRRCAAPRFAAARHTRARRSLGVRATKRLQPWVPTD